MSKKTSVVGLALLILGMFLVLAFWPLFGVSGNELANDWDSNQYESYDEGDVVLVHGTITEVSPEELGGITEELLGGISVEIDDDLYVILANQNSTDLEVGDEVYGTLTLNEGSLIEYWAHDGDMRNKRNIDYLSYGLIGAGIVITAVGVFKD
ncbi:MAG: hypothetical protein ACOCTN_05530 [Candidatus Natronoplasma sp.]